MSSRSYAKGPPSDSDAALLDFLQRTMSISERAPDSAFFAESGGGAGETLSAEARLKRMAAGYGLRVEPWEGTLGEALEACGSQTPVLRPLDEGWAVLYGFQSGAVRLAIVRHGRIEQRKVPRSRLAPLLRIDDDGSVTWLVAEPRQCLGNAAQPDQHHHLPPFNRLLALLRPEQQDLLLVTVFAFGVGLLGLATPVAVQALVNTVAMGGVTQPVVILSVLLFVFLAFSGAIHVLQAYLVEIVQRRIFVRVTADLAYRLPRVRAEVYDRNHGAELVNRFFDVLTVQKAGATLLLEGVATVLQVAISLVVLAFYHPFLLAFDVLLLAAILFVVVVLGRDAVPTAIAESRAKYAVVAWLEQVARNCLTFKLNQGPALSRYHADRLAHDYLSARISHFRVLIRQVIGAVSLHALAGTALLAIGGILVIERQLTLGQLVAAELIVSGVLTSFAKFGKQLESFYDLMAGVDKLGHLLDLPLEREFGEPFPTGGPVGAALALHELGFVYESGAVVLRELSARVEPGERVAVLGPHGSGKSTLADLLCGLREPTHGRIEFNGFDLRDIRLEALHERIAVAGRTEIIEDTVMENVRVGRRDLDPEAIRVSLREVGLADELAIHAEGLRTSLGPNGAPLSSGQARRLMLARAIAGKPVLLVIDGLLDELDEESRQSAWQALSKPQAGWTLIVLTQRQDIAGACDWVIPLIDRDDEGVV